MAEDRVNIDVKNISGFLLLTPDLNKLDVSNAHSLQEGLKKHISSNVQIILNLQHIIFMDSTGLGTMFQIKDQIGQKGGVFRITGIQEKVASLFDMVGAGVAFELFDSLDTALAAPSALH